MGKKSHNREKKLYTKQEFKEIICSQCNTCDKKQDPFFCYSVYKSTKRFFIYYILPKLNETVDWESNKQNLQLFQEAFCENCLNFNAEKEEMNICDMLRNCFNMFISQITSTSYTNKYIEIDKSQCQKPYKQKKHKVEESYIVQPYSTFFHSNKKEWEEEIAEILMEERALNANNN